MFRYHVAGIGLFCGMFYLYHSERVPVGGFSISERIRLEQLTRLFILGVGPIEI